MSATETVKQFNEVLYTIELGENNYIYIGKICDSNTIMLLFDINIKNR